MSTSPSFSSDVSENYLFSRDDLNMSDTSPSIFSEGSENTMFSQDDSSTSEEPVIALDRQSRFDIYTKAVFGYLRPDLYICPDGYDKLTATMRLIKYSENSCDFWNNFRRFIRFASKYGPLLNDDLVMVIQNGANICDEIVYCLEGERKKLKYRYLVGPGNCFILTILSAIHKVTSSTISSNLIHESGLGSLIVTGGCHEVHLRLHSMLEICLNVFSYERSKRIVLNNYEDEVGIKLLDNCVSPSYLPMIQLIQGAQKIPTLIVETVMDDRQKFEVDCISTILGVNFMVESAIGLDLHTQSSSKILTCFDVMVFDVSICAMLAIFRSLSNDYEKGLVSVVLKRKAQFKLDEVRAIRKLKECVDGNGDYESVCDSIARQYRERMKHDYMQHLNTPGLPDKDHLRETFQEFGFNNDRLRSEESYYQNVINTCDDAWKITGQHLDCENIRKAESFMMQQICRHRTIQTIPPTRNKKRITVPGTALSSTYWWRQSKVVVPAETLRTCFGHISSHYRQGKLEQYTLKVMTPWHWLRDESHAAVALLNCPDNVPKEAALGHLKQLYENYLPRIPKIKTRFEHWTSDAIERQLREWRNKKYDKLDRPYTKPSKRPVSSYPGSSLRRGSKRLKSQYTPEQKKLPPKVDLCLTTLEWPQREKLRRSLLKDEFDEVLQEINGDELALRGLKLVFQEKPAVARCILSIRSLAIRFLREHALTHS